MGTQDVKRSQADGEGQRAFVRALLRDVEALETLLGDGRVESGVNRIGAEQEVAIVDLSGRPASINDAILDELRDDPRFTCELGKFNLEFNLDPLRFEGDCLGRLEDQINAMFARVRSVAHGFGSQVVMVGILPSLAKADLGIENITDRPRYHQLNDALSRMRGGPYELSIRGVDELAVRHDNVMLEACNTSFQVHFQVSPDQFARRYNIAQAVAGPVLAAAVNSPLLFGRRLWRETRIALFEQSIDTRPASSTMREFQGRVSFGTHWIEDGVLEIFQEDIARFKPLFLDCSEEDSLAEVASGHTPRLRNLCLHNGTVYRWNRACYGISDNGKPHLRIENRVLPAGPTVVDEVANAAFWFGLMWGVAQECEDVAKEMAFESARQNFLAAAREGLDAQIKWLGHDAMPARQVIETHLLPLASRGLEAAGIDGAHIEKYMGVIERRVSTGRTGAAWILGSIASMRETETRGQTLCRLTSAIARRQLHGAPVHTWTPVEETEFAGDKAHILNVGQYMTTDLFTVNENDVIDLVTNLMDWKHIRHIPVEDDAHRLVGLVTHRDLMRHLGKVRLKGSEDGRAVAVSEVMNATPLTITPETTTLDAIRLMRENKISCLPIVEGGRQLVGIVTEHDLMRIAAPLLERFLSD